MRETNFNDFAEAIAHILNCVFANEEIKIHLDETLQ